MSDKPKNEDVDRFIKTPPLDPKDPPIPDDMKESFEKAKTDPVGLIEPDDVYTD